MPKQQEDAGREKKYKQNKYAEMVRRNRKIRRQLWPDVEEGMIWGERMHKKEVKGFIRIPRTLPYFFKIMDKLAGTKVSTTYFALWCRSFSEYLVKVNNQMAFAFEYDFESKPFGARHIMKVPSARKEGDIWKLDFDLMMKYLKECL